MERGRSPSKRTSRGSRTTQFVPSFPRILHDLFDRKGDITVPDRRSQHQLIQFILCPEKEPSDEATRSTYFGSPRLPGTSSIGERRRNAALFRDTAADPLVSYDAWLEDAAAKTLDTLISSNAPAMKTQDMAGERERLSGNLKTMLDFRTRDGIALCDLIPQQMYEDVFIRMLLFLHHGSDSLPEARTYREFNAVCRRIARSLLKLMEAENMLSPDEEGIRRMIHVSVLCGYVGINLKSSASAASNLLNRDFIPLNPVWVRSMNAVRNAPAGELAAVARRILETSEQSSGLFGLESLSSYDREVMTKHDPVLLVFFSDDCMESMIDLKRFELMLRAAPDLSVLFVPRNGSYGNDLSYEDGIRVLRSPDYTNLVRFSRSGRFYMSPHGPMAGCIDPRFVSRHLIREIEDMARNRRVVFETKGCRNFEMIRGRLPLPWYAGFNCNRALSIRTVGLDGPPVFFRIPPELDAYDQFAGPAKGFSPSYETMEVNFAGMTVKQLHETLGSPVYRRLLRQFRNEAGLNRRLTEMCDAHGLTLPRLKERIGNGDLPHFCLKETQGAAPCLSGKC